MEHEWVTRVCQWMIKCKKNGASQEWSGCSRPSHAALLSSSAVQLYLRAMWKMEKRACKLQKLFEEWSGQSVTSQIFQLNFAVGWSLVKHSTHLPRPKMLWDIVETLKFHLPQCNNLQESTHPWISREVWVHRIVDCLWGASERTFGACTNNTDNQIHTFLITYKMQTVSSAF